MNHKLLAICALAALTTGIYGCDNGSDDDGLDCSDGVYRAVCVDSKHMMYCDIATMTEMAKVCEGDFTCTEDANGVAECVDPNAPEPKPTVCTDGAVQCNGDYVQTCENNAWKDAASACEHGCENGVCKAAPIDNPDCNNGEKQCNADNSNVQNCANGQWVDADPACEYGCEDGACKEAPVDVECTEEGATQCNEDSSNVQTCTDGRWVDDEPACNFGCEDGVCKEPVPECDTEGATQCNADNSNVQTCTDGSWVDLLPACNYGCEDGACKAAPPVKECETEGATQCAEETVQTCTDGQWVNADSACQYGCVDGACKPEPVCGDGEINGDEECDGTQLNSKTCNDLKPMSSGTLACDPATCKFVTDGCILPEEGAKCDPDKFVESCDGSKVIFCYNGTVINGKYDCADYEGTACIVVDMGKGGFYADCMSEEQKCDKVGETSKACGNDDGYPYSGTLICALGNDGNNYNVLTKADYCGEGDFADAPSCLAETGECGKLSEKEGTACDSETQEYECDGADVILYCNKNVWNAYTCPELIRDDTKCVSMGGDIGDNCLLACTMPSDPESEISVCSDDSYYGPQSITGVCTAAPDGSGNYLVQTEYEVDCAHNCDAATGECIKIVDNEGESCDYYEFEASCAAGEIAVNCDDWDEVVVAEQCKTGSSCHIVDEFAECLSACTNPGTTSSVCESIIFMGYDFSTTYHTTCETLDGGNFEVMTSESCNNGCNEAGDGCLRLSDKEGTACDSEKDLQICDGSGVILQCNESTNTWDAFACDTAVGAGTVCADMGDEHGAYCYQPCSKVGDEALVCEVQESFFGTYYYSVNYICTANDEGTANYLVMDYYTYCDSDACNETTGECAEKTYAPCDDTCEVDGGMKCADYCVATYGEGTSCTLDGSYVKCGASCTAGDPDTVQCEYYIGTQWEGDIDAYVAHCTELTDGTYMWVREDSYEECAPSTCTEGVGCDE